MSDAYSPFSQFILSSWDRIFAPKPFAGRNVPWIVLWGIGTFILAVIATVEAKAAILLAVTMLFGSLISAARKGQ